MDVIDIKNIAFQKLTDADKIVRHNEKSSSYYYYDGTRVDISDKKVSIRVSDHGVGLNNAAKTMRQPDDNGITREPSEYQNISLVFKGEDGILNKKNINRLRVKDKFKPTFSIFEYIYNAPRLSEDDVAKIFDAVRDVIDGKTKMFVDPLAKTQNHAHPHQLRSNSVDNYLLDDTPVISDKVLKLGKKLYEGTNRNKVKSTMRRVIVEFLQQHCIPLEYNTDKGYYAKLKPWEITELKETIESKLAAL